MYVVVYSHIYFPSNNQKISFCSASIFFFRITPSPSFFPENFAGCCGIGRGRVSRIFEFFPPPLFFWGNASWICSKYRRDILRRWPPPPPSPRPHSQIFFFFFFSFLLESGGKMQKLKMEILPPLFFLPLNVATILATPLPASQLSSGICFSAKGNKILMALPPLLETNFKYYHVPTIVWQIPELSALLEKKLLYAFGPM